MAAGPGAPSPSSRDLEAYVRYLVREPRSPPPAAVPLPADPWISGGARAEAVSERQLMQIADIRTLKGGASSFTLDTHGITFHPAPPQPEGLGSVDPEVRARAVELEYGPKVVQLAKDLTGADKGFLYQFLIRGADQGALDWHVHVAHSDYSPNSPPTLRQDLVERFKMPKGDADSCDLAVLGMWHPRTWPAWTEPLALLDWSSLDRYDPLMMPGKVLLDLLPPMTEHTKEFHREDKRRAERLLAAGGNTSAGSQYGRFGDGTKGQNSASNTANGYFKSDETFINGPSYHPGHRWVYCSDMQPEEAWFFKHFDTRDNVPKCAFHNAVVDPFHMRDEPEKPFRRSVEVRVLLTFPKKMAGALAASKL